MKTPIIETEKLSKSYAADGVQTHVLSNIDLVLHEGDFTAIMGPSGSGKSTLLYCLSGMDTPTAGDVRYRGGSVTGLRERDMAELRAQHFGFVFQQAHLVSNLTLFENVAVPGYLKKGRSTAATRAAASALIERMGLTQEAHHLPSQTSGGQQQRCAVARSVVNDPDIVFADEPTGSLNRANTIEVLALLCELNGNGQSICMVTHDVQCAVRANRILYLEDGAVCGELDLPAWCTSGGVAYVKAREAQVSAWLSSLSW
ncbi:MULTISPECIES: ABC transporter ATP-binding protein [Eggerthella]|uniref:ABC transporter ATP-binding protein n=2 Tax=Eggerthella TaxID=84111 RepID=A0ABD7GN18_EGGLN|nr:MULTISPECIES: ABC transporter ATP-binding protein [Eggerthella]MDB1797693.1 ABC transporter ATP-binding protein [Eggerthella lenta]MZJ93469.1 ATP-binding cassette domain-containing protein [Eggerthella sp. BIOML-A3]MZJ98983.1 ATP-binding cassette domain-containing protein [Eggerthella sp. BIOML-A1]MZK35907.1 ATP-binding cassette domain-containing protein [Eggerthella sp. BIOML-A5]RDC18125.1 ABC transporter ATP-binding protein [Eggerthella lenta]